MNSAFGLSTLAAIAGIAVAGFSIPVHAMPTAPIYTTTFEDATTFQNRFVGTDGKWHWTVDPGADDFPNDVYERPVMSGFRPYTDTATGEVKYATDDDYFGYLDITEARAGFDDTYLYLAIDLHDINRYKSNQQAESNEPAVEYRIRMSDSADGRGGFMFNIEGPRQNQLDLVSAGDDPYSWVTTRNYVYWDEDADLPVDGPTPDLLSDNGTGFETEIVNDGKVKSGFSQFGSENDTPFYSRISPTENDNIVEFAIEYGAFGFSEADLENLAYLVFESNRGNGNGAEHPHEFLWNHQFSTIEAGSPYADSNDACSDPDLSIYCTDGLERIAELDTLNGGGIAAVPEPATLLLLFGGLATIGISAIRRR